MALKTQSIENQKTQIGYWLSQYEQGKGIMSHSVARIIEYAFNVMNMNRIQINVAVENTKSRKIPERLGFQREGIERDGELLVSGFTDIMVYSLLKKEFKNNILKCKL